MNLKEVCIEIQHGRWSNDDLNTIIEAVKWKRAQLAKSVKSSIRPGTVVHFNSQKMGGVVSGTVESVKIKFATVNTSRGRWRVPINMLETA
jgi:hypothetical protein